MTARRVWDCESIAYAYEQRTGTQQQKERDRNRGGVGIRTGEVWRQEGRCLPHCTWLCVAQSECKLPNGMVTELRRCKRSCVSVQDIYYFTRPARLTEDYSRLDGADRSSAD